VENRLYKAGILTFAQLAALSPGEIVAQVAGLASAERIIKQDWIGQARALAARPAAAPPVELPDHMGAGSSSQHYATFAVELLLDENNHVNRTRVMHVQSGDEDLYLGWREPRLIEFLVQHAGLNSPTAEL